MYFLYNAMNPGYLGLATATIAQRLAERPNSNAYPHLYRHPSGYFDSNFAIILQFPDLQISRNVICQS